MTDALPFLAAFFILCGVGALAAWLVPARWNAGLLATIGSLAALLLLVTSATILIGDASFKVELWPVLALGTLKLEADQLSALFLFVLGLVFLPVSLFSAFYLEKYAKLYSLRYFNVLYFALFASIVLVLIASDAISFLVAWEAMSIVSYLLVTFETDHEESAHAGFVMLAMSDAGTVAVAVAFILIAGSAGSVDFATMRSAGSMLGEGMAWVVLLLSFFGFAVKAGLVPLNSWLPMAHPVAPTNVSALLSTVIVNLGIYVIIRFSLDFVAPATPGPGIVVLIVGSISAVGGILYATIQSEMKRLLAYSTIENMGIIAAALGAAMVFLATGHRSVAGIALIAALYHLANHSVYKALLFIGIGAMEAGTGIRDLDRLGGIARRMPWTSAFFLIGVLSIAALPPLNGFVSEWLTLQTVLRSALLTSTPIKIAFAVSGALLALTAGLAVTCFAKVFAMGFLGMARSDGAAQAVEVRFGTRVPMALLAVACVALGVLPTYTIPVLDRAAAPLAHASSTAALVPPFFSPILQQRENVPPAFLTEFHDLGSQTGSGILPGRGLVVLHRGEASNPVVFTMSTSYMLVTLAGLLIATFLAFRLLTRGHALARSAAWDGGVRRLWPGITYTATGFSNPVRVVFRGLLRPTVVQDSTDAVARHFRTAIRREDSDIPIVDRLLLEPSVQGLQMLAAVVRRMHVGQVNAYAAYILLVLLLVLIAGTGLL